MTDKLDQLRARLHTVRDLQYASSLLRWDSQTYMPNGGAEARANQLATLDELSHTHFIADEMGALLDDLAAMEAELDYDGDEASLIRVTRRDYERARRIPPELVAELARAAMLGQQAWQQARANSDFAHFQPYLEKNVELVIRQAECYDVPPGGSLYDPLLDGYEPEVTSAEVQAVFDAVRPALVDLTARIAERQDIVDDSLLHQPFDEQAQMAFSEEMSRGLGFDFERGRQDRSVHPFSSTIGLGDVRITTRVDPAYPAMCWFGTIHETGHGLYDQNISERLARTPLDQGASMAVHESQSRLYENKVARGRAFWEHFFPQAQARFPDALGGANADAFYAAVNKSRPSLIRVEADEVTYGLHIILRFELEQALVSGEVKVADLPDLWNERMQSYLGITPPDDAQGVLQDIHWSEALFGYFPTYLLGSIFSAQLYAAALEAVPGLEEGFARGEFGPLLGWLRENVHRHGRKFTLAELAERVTGGPLDTGPYVGYLETKFGALYALAG